eukprot:gene6156-7668_t
MAGSTEYHYKKISQLNTALLDFYGIVYHIGPVKESSNSKEKTITIKVADGTEPQDTFLVMLYYDRDSFIEHIRVGSITRFHRLKRSSAIPNVSDNRGVGNVDRSNCGFAMLIFNTFTDPIKPLSSTGNFTLERKDLDIVRDLKRLWEDIRPILTKPDEVTTTTAKAAPQLPFHGAKKQSAQKHVSTTAAGSYLYNTFKVTSIEDLQDKTYVTVVAKVLDKQFSIVNQKRATVKLWDGTGEGYQWDPSETHLGKMIFANTWNQDQINQIETINIGSWIKITGVKVCTFKEVLELKLQVNSAITVLPNNDQVVLLHLKNHNNKLNYYETISQLPDNRDNNDEDEEQQQRRQTSPDTDNNLLNQIKITDTFYPHVPITTIQEVKNCIKVPNKFKINVKFQQHIPLTVQDFTRIYCKSCHNYSEMIIQQRNDDLLCCTRCTSNIIEYVYLFKFIVNDSTGELPIIFSDKHTVNLILQFF